MISYTDGERIGPAPPEPTPGEWARHRLIRLVLPCLDDEEIRLELLRDETWLLEHGATVGGTVFLNMPEMGVEGEATVEAIEPCPPIEPGHGRVVTGTFHHSSGITYDLKLKGEPDPIGVTASHPIWSVDRQAWASAGDLSPGETVQTLNGTTHVQSVTRRSVRDFVTNLEVEGDHVYRIARCGLLVHNDSVDDCECDIAYSITGPNPNGLVVTKVSGNTTTDEGVYVKKHFNKKKAGMTLNFRTRYNLSNPEGGCNIWYEIPRTKHGPPSTTSAFDAAYWTESRQRRFDEAYIFGTIPAAERFGIRPVSPDLWRQKRHIFGYGGLPGNYLD